MEHKKPDPGALLENLDFVANEQGPVLGSDPSSIIVAAITDFSHFPQSGQFTRLAPVNGGMRLWVGQDDSEPVLEDPHRFSNRLVGPADTSAEAGG